MATKKKNNPFLCGIELECQVPSPFDRVNFNNNFPNWLVDTDSSINQKNGFYGREFKPINPMKLENLMTELKEISSHANKNNWQTDASCGSHIHISAAPFIANESPKNFTLQLLKNFLAIEKGIYAYNGQDSRRYGTYAGSVKKEIEILENKDFPYEKYWGLNIRTLTSYGSYEFRFPVGSLDFSIHDFNLSVVIRILQMTADKICFPNFEQMTWDQAFDNMVIFLFGKSLLKTRIVNKARKQILIGINSIDPLRVFRTSELIN